MSSQGPQVSAPTRPLHLPPHPGKGVSGAAASQWVHAPFATSIPSLLCPGVRTFGKALISLIQSPFFLCLRSFSLTCQWGGSGFAVSLYSALRAQTLARRLTCTRTRR